MGLFDVFLRVFVRQFNTLHGGNPEFLQPPSNNLLLRSIERYLLQLSNRTKMALNTRRRA
jgi:hypothetical protein